MEENQEIETKPVFYKKELIIASVLILAISLIFALLSLIYKGPFNMTSLKMGKDSSTYIELDLNALYYSLSFAAAEGIILACSVLFFPVIGKEKPVMNKLSSWIIMSVLYLLGICAYAVIVIGLMTFKINLLVSTLVASLIYLIYLYLMIKMYFFSYVSDKRVFYEIVRFALVGVIAAMFDFSTCYVFEYFILPQTWQAIYLTIGSVTAGFIVGVTVNYLCSVYMVFKDTTSKDTSKTPKGRFMFVFLSAVGLLFGYGLQYLFYDFMGVGYVLTFIIRTLIVLVWNYLSRKYLIFR
jgi:putative flippase GtrA